MEIVYDTYMLMKVKRLIVWTSLEEERKRQIPVENIKEGLCQKALETRKLRELVHCGTLKDLRFGNV